MCYPLSIHIINIDYVFIALIAFAHRKCMYVYYVYKYIIHK